MPCHVIGISLGFLSIIKSKRGACPSLSGMGSGSGSGFKIGESFSSSKIPFFESSFSISILSAIISYESIENNIYIACSSKNAIKLLIKSLREKTSKNTITNVSGFGYKIHLDKNE